MYFDFDGNLFTVGWTGSHFVVAGSGPHVPHQHRWDGLATAPQPEDLELRDMAWNGDRLVAVGGRSESTEE